MTVAKAVLIHVYALCNSFLPDLSLPHPCAFKMHMLHPVMIPDVELVFGVVSPPPKKREPIVRYIC
jgi:hypothetical protein